MLFGRTIAATARASALRHEAATAHGRLPHVKSGLIIASSLGRNYPATVPLRTGPKSVDKATPALYCEQRNIQEARLLITITRVVGAVLAVLSSSLKFLSLRSRALIFSRNSHGYRYS
jgi:hypothetical protein